MTLAEILRDSDYKQSQFNLFQIQEFEKKIIIRTDSKGKEAQIERWKEQLKSYCNATGVPIVDYKIQQQITALVEDSFRLRHESEQLLERAKQAVEVAIEKGESEGIKILD